MLPGGLSDTEAAQRALLDSGCADARARVPALNEHVLQRLGGRLGRRASLPHACAAFSVPLRGHFFSEAATTFTGDFTALDRADALRFERASELADEPHRPATRPEPGRRIHQKAREK